MTRDEARRHQQLPDVSAVADGVILALWRSGYDSLDIARHTNLREFLVYNRLLRIRQEAGNGT